VTVPMNHRATMKDGNRGNLFKWVRVILDIFGALGRAGALSLLVILSGLVNDRSEQRTSEGFDFGLSFGLLVGQCIIVLLWGFMDGLQTNSAALFFSKWGFATVAVALASAIPDLYDPDLKSFYWTDSLSELPIQMFVTLGMAAIGFAVARLGRRRLIDPHL
jgi:hypothetical protein